MVSGSIYFTDCGETIVNKLITFFHLNAFFPLQSTFFMVEYIYKMNKEELKCKF